MPLIPYTKAMSKSGRNIKKYLLRVKKSVKNIRAGMKKEIPIRKKSFCFLHIL
jgi:hypothetical protein